MSNLEVVDYSQYSLAIFGDTKPVKEEIKEIGGKFNKALKHGGARKAGWIVSKKKQSEVDDLVAGKFKRKREDSSESSESAGSGASEPQKKRICVSDDKPFIATYSEKSIAVFGDSRPYKEHFKGLRGKYNKYLKHDGTTRPGWLFQNKYKEEVEKILGISGKSGEKKEEEMGDEVDEDKKETQVDEEKAEEIPQEEKKLEETPQKSSAQPFIVQYNLKSIAVLGDSRSVKDKLKELGGKYNKYLTHEGKKQPGWIFQNKSRESVEECLGISKENGTEEEEGLKEEAENGIDEEAENGIDEEDGDEE